MIEMNSSCAPEDKTKFITLTRLVSHFELNWHAAKKEEEVKISIA